MGIVKSEVSLRSSIMQQKCGKCDKVFITKCDLDIHLKCHKMGRRGRPKSIPKSTITCSDCDQVFFRRCDFRLHRRMEHTSTKSTCPVCHRTFANEKCLKSHAHFHNDGGEFACLYCNKEFNKGWKMKVHLVNHTGRAPYICQYCDEDFLYSGKIIEHLKREHDIYLVCKECGMGFRNAHELDVHSCKLYGCKDCIAWFHTPWELTSHIKCHEIKDEKDVLLVVQPSITNPIFPIDSDPDYIKKEIKCEESESQYHSQNKSYDQSIPITPQGMHSVGKLMSNSPLKIEDDSKHSDSTLPGLHNQGTVFSGIAKLHNLKPGGFPPTDNHLNSLNHKPPMPHQETIKSTLSKGNSKTKDGIDCPRTSHPGDGDVVPETNKAMVGISSGKCAESNNEKKVYNFKVPKPSFLSGKRFINILKKQPQQNKCIQNKINNWEFGIDKHTSIKQEQTSLKSWLTSDNTPRFTNDFVFGRGLKSPINLLESSHKSHLTNLKKQESDMTFEDLCQF